MKDVFKKLRGTCSICWLDLKILWCKVRPQPFQIASACIKRYFELRKIDKESKDGWEKHIKIKELEGNDKLELRRTQFDALKIQLISAFLKTSIYAESCDRLKELTNEVVEDSRKEFQKNKEELVSLLEKFCEYEEITFDEKMKSGIISWEFVKFETQEELIKWIESFSKYICTLDII